MEPSDYEGFDIDRSTQQGWDEFQARLSEVISVIDDTADLLIGTETERTDNGGPFVSFSAPARDMIRSEAASNAVLGDAFQLNSAHLAAMERAGWNPPSAGGDGETGSANFWIELPQEQSDRLAELAVVALRDVYGVPHPVFLAPDQLAEILTPKADDPTPTAPVYDEADVTAVMPRDRQHLDDLVDAELTDLFGHHPIRDSEGDVTIRVGTTMIFLRTSEDGREIVIFSALVHELEGRSRAVEVLNDLNVEARWVKFQLIRDRVFVTLSVMAHPFVPAHLAQAVQVMADVADGIDEELADKLRGRTTFDEGDPE